MAETLPKVYLVRHGETAWSLSGQHTGRTDLPLTERGELDATRIGRRLAGQSFARVFTSPLQRARRTCALAGFEQAAVVNADLSEWNYGDYEGLRTAEIRQQRPDWQLFRDGGPGGESVADVGARADRVLALLRSDPEGNTLVFSSGHFLRVLAARWLGLEPADGRLFILGTASVSIVGYEHTRSEPALLLWNDRQHLCDPAK